MAVTVLPFSKPIRWLILTYNFACARCKITCSLGPIWLDPQCGVATPKAQFSLKPYLLFRRPSRIHGVVFTLSILIREGGTGMRLNRTIFAAYAALFFAVSVSAQGNPQRPGRPEMAGGQTQGGQEGAKGAEKHLPPPEEKSSVTHHTVRIGGQEINYTATAATYVIKADD